MQKNPGETPISGHNLELEIIMKEELGNIMVRSAVMVIIRLNGWLCLPLALHPTGIRLLARPALKWKPPIPRRHPYELSYSFYLVWGLQLCDRDKPFWIHADLLACCLVAHVKQLLQ